MRPGVQSPSSFSSLGFRPYWADRHDAVKIQWDCCCVSWTISQQKQQCAGQLNSTNSLVPKIRWHVLICCYRNFNKIIKHLLHNTYGAGKSMTQGSRGRWWGREHPTHPLPQYAILINNIFFLCNKNNITRRLFMMLKKELIQLEIILCDINYAWWDFRLQQDFSTLLYFIAR